MLYIYTPEVTKRLEYTLNFIFNGVLRVKYELTTDYSSCLHSKQPFINYSLTSCGHGFWIPSHNLLRETGRRGLQPKMGVWESMPTLFSYSEGDLPFDLFSAVFYLITRYEEYNSTELDRFGRFNHEASVAFQFDFLHRPLIDEWLLRLKDLLNEKYPHIEISLPKYKCYSTIDVDHVYRYLGKSKLLMASKFFKLLFNLDFVEAMRMLKVLTYIEKDPYHQFSYLDKLHHGLSCKYILFMHWGRYAKYDRKTIYPLVAFYNYLRQQNHSYIIGLHPSYHAAFTLKRIEEEKRKLERCLRYPITYSRNHYLRIRVPETYRMLDEMGINQDFSMGYAGMYGFRASTCHPFFFYDLELDKVTRLRIHPNLLMDGTLKNYLKVTPEEALQLGKSIVDQCRAVNGEFIMLWHNNSVAGLYEWSGWRPVFEELLQYATRKSAVQ